MKPLLFLLPVTLFTATALMAQPVMDQVDAPQDGDQLWYMLTSHVAITTTGEDVMRDLSSLATGEEQLLSFLDPAVTGHGAEYPTSNVVLTDGAVQMYLRTDATGIYTVGQYQATSGFQLRMHFSDEELVLPYPCTYNTAFADTSTYSYPFQGYRAWRWFQGLHGHGFWFLGAAVRYHPQRADAHGDQFGRGKRSRNDLPFRFRYGHFLSPRHSVLRAVSQ